MTKKESDKKYRDKNKVKLNEYSKQYAKDNSNKVKEYAKKYREANSNKVKEYAKKYREANSVTKSISKPKQTLSDEERKAKQRTYYHANKTRIKANFKKYYDTNKSNITPNIEKRKARYIERSLNEPLFKVRKNIRSLIAITIKNKGYKKLLKSETILGCTFQQFKEHLESQFEPWMNWDNYGNWNGVPTEPNTAWDIDHIIPCSSAITEEDIIKLNHYTNLKPLCSYFNRWIKGSNV